MKKQSKLATILQMKLVPPSSGKMKTILQIKGTLPDKAWRLEHEKVTINEYEKKVEVKIFASRDPTIMAAQVMVNFTKEIPLELKSKGQWKIDCNNFSININIV
ncbi:MAG: hypothetical protein ACTSSG_14105 [Candidatus Heimdallarchaeaceae archaeon]